MITLWVALGAAIGAPARYLADRAVQSRHDSTFPWGTFAVNVAGSLLLGVLAGAGSRLPAAAYAALGTGFCGALTTYSTFGFETLRLVENRARTLAASYAVASLAGGFGALTLGWALGTALR